MIKLKDLIKEADEPTDSNEWDNWIEYIKYFEYELEKVELAKLLKRFGLMGKKYLDGKVLKLWDKSVSIFLEYDIDNETYSYINDINQWVYDCDTSFIDVDDIYSGYIGTTLKSMKQSPGNVYHYTTEEKWAEIQRSGKMVGSSGTGLNNRSAYGIFTSVDPEEYVIGTYGDVCLEIDLAQFKNDSGLPELDLSYEPDVEEYLIREYIQSALELDTPIDLSSDISPFTIIVGHSIPVKYIRRLND